MYVMGVNIVWGGIDWIDLVDDRDQYVTGVKIVWGGIDWIDLVVIGTSMLWG
jgi:hypothetical protein